MIYIEKTREPESWTRHRLTPGADYEASDDLRDRLLKDQGYVCAYCMRRIPAADDNTINETRIEHIRPRTSLSRLERMDYANMVICCPGAISKITRDKKHLHCDRRKGEDWMNISPLDSNAMATIGYMTDGTIKSTDSEYDHDINDVLNLNHNLLKGNRLETWKAVVKVLDSKGWTVQNVRNILNRFSMKDRNGMLPAYCGIVRYHLSRWLARQS